MVTMRLRDKGMLDDELAGLRTSAGGRRACRTQRPPGI